MTKSIRVQAVEKILRARELAAAKKKAEKDPYPEPDYGDEEYIPMSDDPEFDNLPDDIRLDPGNGTYRVKTVNLKTGDVTGDVTEEEHMQEIEDEGQLKVTPAALPGVGGGLTSYGLLKIIQDNLIPGMNLKDLETLQKVVAHYAKIKAKRWTSDYTSADATLNQKEKELLQGTRTPGNRNAVPKKLAAIKSVRDRLGYGLRDAKMMCEAYMEGVNEGAIALLPSRLALWEEEDLTPEELLTHEEKQLIAVHLEPWKSDPKLNLTPSLMEAIHSVRYRFKKWPLKEVKALVDAYRERVESGDAPNVPPKGVLAGGNLEGTIDLDDDFVD